MSFYIPMKELIKELKTIRAEAEEWDPDGQIEWDITVYVLSLNPDPGFTYTYEVQKTYFFDIDEGRRTRDYINESFPNSNAKLLKVVVKLNRK